MAICSLWQILKEIGSLSILMIVVLEFLVFMPKESQIFSKGNGLTRGPSFKQPLMDDELDQNIGT